jgi:hypothetical protein
MGLSKQLRQRCLLFLEWCAAQIFAAKLEGVESEQHSFGLGLTAVTQAIEHRMPSSPQITTSPDYDSCYRLVHDNACRRRVLGG